MLGAKFDPKAPDRVESVWAASEKLVGITIDIWNRTKARMLPTPAKFHYIFNLRELSRVFQGIMLTPAETIRTGGYMSESGKVPFDGAGVTLLRIWKHECERVFCDKLTNNKDNFVLSSAIRTSWHLSEKRASVKPSSPSS
jgi:dynein heavy chain